MKFFRMQKKMLFESVTKKMWSRFSYAALSDLFFYSLFAAVIYLFSQTLDKISQPLSSYSNDALQQQLLDPVKSGLYQAQLMQVLFKSFFSIIVFVVVISVLCGIFKGFIWDILLKKDPHPRRMLRYGSITLFWIIVNIIIDILISVMFNTTVALVILFLQLIAMLHLSIMSYFFIGKNQRFWKAVKLSFRELKRFHHYIIPYLLILILGILIALFSYVTNLPFMLAKLQSGVAISVVISSLLLLLEFAWARYYLMQSFILSHKKNKS